jgi:hypothetical protein
MRGLIDAAKALAMTVVDLVAEPAMLVKAKKELAQDKESG